MDYKRFQMMARQLIAASGRSYSITRKGKVTMVAGREHREPDMSFDATGVRTAYRVSEIDGTRIQSEDVLMVFSPDAELRTGDLVDVDGIPHRIVQPNPVKPARELVCYRAQLRV